MRRHPAASHFSTSTQSRSNHSCGRQLDSTGELPYAMPKMPTVSLIDLCASLQISVVLGIEHTPLDALQDDPRLPRDTIVRHCPESSPNDIFGISRVIDAPPNWYLDDVQSVFILGKHSNPDTSTGPTRNLQEFRWCRLTQSYCRLSNQCDSKHWRTRRLQWHIPHLRLRRADAPNTRVQHQQAQQLPARGRTGVRRVLRLVLELDDGTREFLRHLLKSRVVSLDLRNMTGSSEREARCQDAGGRENILPPGGVEPPMSAFGRRSSVPAWLS